MRTISKLPVLVVNKLAAYPPQDSIIYIHIYLPASTWGARNRPELSGIPWNCQGIPWNCQGIPWKSWNCLNSCPPPAATHMPTGRLPMGVPGVAAAAVMLNLVATGVISPELGLTIGAVHIARGQISQSRTRARDTDKPRRMDWGAFRREYLKGDKDFRRYLRVSPELFDRMVAGITPDDVVLNRQRRAAQNAAGRRAINDPDGPRGGFVEYPLRVAMTLRYLAGGSYLDLCYIFGVRKSTFYSLVWQTLELLDKCPALPDMTLEQDVHNQQRCRALAAGFNRRTGGGHVNGCIGALDGMALKIEAPNTSDNFHKYFCRKLFHAVSVQAVCDADRRFTYLDMSQSGSTHDSTAWNVARTLDGEDRISLSMANSEVLKAGCDVVAPHGFFLVADDAYRCCPTVMSPWSGAAAYSRASAPCPPPVPTLTRRSRAPAGATLGSYEDSFNHQLSRGRINIECTFGMLTQKFLILVKKVDS